jgi:hypothetical protein
VTLLDAITDGHARAREVHADEINWGPLEPAPRIDPLALTNEELAVEAWTAMRAWREIAIVAIRQLAQAIRERDRLRAALAATRAAVREKR